MRTWLFLSALAVTLRAVLLVGGAVAAVEIEPPDNPIFAADAALECVHSRTAKLASGLTEGPATAPDGSVYFSDMPFGPQHDTIIHRFDPATKMLSVFTASAGKANGLAFDAEGRLLAADGADGAMRVVAFPLDADWPSCRQALRISRADSRTGAASRATWNSARGTTPIRSTSPSTSNSSASARRPPEPAPCGPRSGK